MKHIFIVSDLSELRSIFYNSKFFNNYIFNFEENNNETYSKINKYKSCISALFIDHKSAFTNEDAYKFLSTDNLIPKIIFINENDSLKISEMHPFSFDGLISISDSLEKNLRWIDSYLDQIYNREKSAYEDSLRRFKCGIISFKKLVNENFGSFFNKIDNALILNEDKSLELHASNLNSINERIDRFLNYSTFKNNYETFTKISGARLDQILNRVKQKQNSNIYSEIVIEPSQLNIGNDDLDTVVELSLEFLMKTENLISVTGYIENEDYLLSFRTDSSTDLKCLNIESIKNYLIELKSNYIENIEILTIYKIIKMTNGTLMIDNSSGNIRNIIIKFNIHPIEVKYGK